MKIRIVNGHTDNIRPTIPPCPQAFKDGESWYVEVKTLNDLLELYDTCKDVENQDFFSGLILNSNNFVYNKKTENSEFYLEIFNDYLD
jgi:hypothetical protein